MSQPEINYHDSNSIETKGKACQSDKTNKCSCLGFAWQDIILRCQCLEGTYPDCEQLLARFSFDREVILEKAFLVKALERLAVLTDKKEKGIYLQFDGSL
jgi:DNA polymerase III sliding clamp (beta) subunit (PCNA family)